MPQTAYGLAHVNSSSAARKSQNSAETEPNPVIGCQQKETMTFSLRCVGKFVMATTSRRNVFIRLFGLLVIASLFTSYLMFVRVSADVQRVHVTRKDGNMATSSSVRKISGGREVESPRRIRSSETPVLRGDSHIGKNKKQVNTPKSEANGLALVKKSRLSIIRRVFRDKRALKTVRGIRNNSMANTPTDARQNSRLSNGEAFRDKNAAMRRNITKSVILASGAETVVNNLSSAMLGSFRGDPRRPDQKPLESKRVTVVMNKPGSTRNGNSSSVPEYDLRHDIIAKRTTVQIGKQLEDESRGTLADISRPGSTPLEKSTVIGDSFKVNNGGQKPHKRIEDGRADISKTAMANVKKPEPAPSNNSQVVGDAFRHVNDARTNARKQAPLRMTAVGAEKKANASLRVRPLGFGRVVAGIRREPVKQKLGQIDDIVTPEGVTSPRTNLIIVAQPRTGSSFLGDAFNQHPDVFYLFEPLHGIVHTTLQHLKDPKPMHFLAGMLLCKFSQLTYVKEIERFRRFSSSALSSPPLCTKKTFVGTPRKKCVPLTTRNVEAICKSKYNVTVMKILTSRIPNGTVKSLFPLCNSTTNCTMIYLVRDPRPVVFSHMKVGMQSWQNFKSRGAGDPSPRPSIKMYSATVCEQIEANVKIFKNLTGRMKSQYRILRYEDLAGHPTETLRGVYKMVGLTMVNSTLEWIELHTTGKRGKSHNSFSTERNSRATVDNWRLEIDPCVVNIIEHSCRSVLKLLGYKPLNGSEQMQYDLNMSLIDGQ